jgi:outer membrane protein OmpA-like peptidoglycan-associated protein
MSLTLRVFVAGTGAAVSLALLGGPGAALPLEFPGPATATVARTVPLATYKLPLAPWADGAIPTQLFEGARSDSAWRVDGGGLSTLQLLAPLRDQVQEAGYRVLWECETEGCGGFDFRFGTDVLDEPDMHVDLGDFRFLAAERDGPAGPEALSLLVSRSSDMGFVQMITIGAAINPVPLTAPDPGEGPSVSISPAEAGTLAEQLDGTGAVSLDDLTFESGSALLGQGQFASLDALAAYLKANPQRTIALVGHTDASGNLATNIALSTARAASVRDRLIRDFGVPAARVSAEGVGYLAPRASNLTPEGRARNRRVEAVVTSTQ